VLRQPGGIRAGALVAVAALSSACATDRTSAVRPRGRASRVEPAGPAMAAAPTTGPTVVVVADVELTPRERAAMVARVRAAFAFALEACEWSATDMIAAAPLELHIAALPTGTAARTTGPRALSVASNALGQADMDGVLAHELTHLQDFRAARGGLRSIPRYLVEGRALSIGREFRRSLGICGSDAERVRAIASLTGNQAAEALAGFRDGSGLRLAKRDGAVFRWMSASVFFIEFLRRRGHATGRPDAFARLSRTFERVGRGETFDDAFMAEFSRPLGSLEREFVDVVTSTEGDRAARLRGTAYENSDCARAPR
jgi:hypothetical protein